MCTMRPFDCVQLHGKHMTQDLDWTFLTVSSCNATFPLVRVLWIALSEFRVILLLLLPMRCLTVVHGFNGVYRCMPRARPALAWEPASSRSLGRLRACPMSLRPE